MDNNLLGVLLSIVRGIPDSKIAAAESAADRAEDAAELAEQHNMGVAVSGTTIVFSEEA